jgi:SNF2 family DNA or RNA helicase
MLSRSNLHHYQRRAVSFIETVSHCALFLDMGAGKTISTLTAIVDLLDDFAVSRVLVVAPLRVANTVWHTEARNWEHTRHLDFAIATGPMKNRLAALAKEATVTVINRENIPWLVDYYGAAWPFDMVVIDESSSFKSHSSKRFRAMKKVRSRIERMVLLTGTPASNGYIDLWSQVFLLDGGQRLGRTITLYRNTYFDSDYFGYTYTLRPGADKAIQRRISDIVLSLDPTEYQELPDNLHLVLANPLEGKLLKDYLKFESEALLSLGNEEEVSAVSAAVLTNKLLQFCSGAIYGEPDEKGKRPVHHFHDLKLDTLEEIMETASDNVLVAYNYKHSLERILKRFPYAEVMGTSGDEVERWNAGHIRMLLVHPKSSGHGINLQHGGHTLVWFDYTWSLEEYQQLNKRLHRQGQKEMVRTIHIAVGPAEEKLMRALGKKDVTQKQLLEALI